MRHTQVRKSHGVFREADDFIRQLRRFGNLEMRPDPNSKPQMLAATNVADEIQIYEDATRRFLEKVAESRRQTRSVEWLLEQGKSEPNFDETKSAATMKFATGILERNIESLWTSRYIAASALVRGITTATALGVIRPSEGLRQKLEECQEEKRRLSIQILEYKKQLKLH